MLRFVSALLCLCLPCPGWMPWSWSSSSWKPVFMASTSLVYREAETKLIGTRPCLGIFLVILVGALEALYERHKRGDSCVLLLSVSACLFISITAVRVLILFAYLVLTVNIHVASSAGCCPCFRRVHFPTNRRQWCIRTEPRHGVFRKFV